MILMIRKPTRNPARYCRSLMDLIEKGIDAKDLTEPLVDVT